VGIVLTLAGFSAAIAAWFAILLAYKASKRSIVHEIGERVKVEDLSDSDATGRVMSDSAYKLSIIPESAAEMAGHNEKHASRYEISYEISSMLCHGKRKRLIVLLCQASLLYQPSCNVEKLHSSCHALRLQS